LAKQGHVKSSDRLAAKRLMMVIKVKAGASIPIYRWRQMRHGQFWGGDEKSIFWEMKKFNIKSVNFVHKFNN